MSGNFAIKGGGVGPLMANAILNFHFDFLNPSLILNLSILQVHLAINRLGLSTISPFNPKERVALIILDLDMYESI